MTATNHTSNYNLSQFEPTDRPTWLGDYNGDMQKLDTQIKANADSIKNATAGALTSVSHTTDLTGKGTSDSPLGVANTIARTSELNSKVDKTAAQPGTLGLTATELDSMYKDADGIVRVGNKN